MGLRTLHWGKSSFDRERRTKSSIESPMLAARVEEVSHPWAEFANSLESMWDARPYRKLKIFPESRLWYVWYWRPPTIVERVKAACPSWSVLVWIQIDDLRWGFWINGVILCQLWWWIPRHRWCLEEIENAGSHALTNYGECQLVGRKYFKILFQASFYFWAQIIEVQPSEI